MGTESEAVVENRKEFCKRYLTELEPYCRRWVQISKEDASALNGLDLQLGHSLFDLTKNAEMLEFHIDYWDQYRSMNINRDHDSSPYDDTSLTPTAST